MRSTLLILPAAALALLPFLASKADFSATGSPENSRAAGIAKGVSDMAAAAQNFLASLDADQKALATFKLDDPERQNWKFTPVERKGITLQQLRPEQDHLALALLNSAMSNEGFAKAVTIMSQERILFDLENSSPKRNPEKYHILIFGEPSTTGSWAWRFEGHHFSCSVTIAGGKLVSMTPSFMGTNPGEVKDGPRKGLRMLKDEEDLAVQLVKSFTDEQKKDGVLPGAAPADVLSAEKPKADPLNPAGIASSKLDEKQRAMLWNVIGEYIGRFRPELSEPVRHKLATAGDPKITFAWIGGTEPGQGKYYRIQSPEFLFEFDNTQNNCNHPHATWRDFNGDFGTDILAAHLKAEHGK
jgi:hypothetical protein